MHNGLPTKNELDNVNLEEAIKYIDSLVLSRDGETPLDKSIVKITNSEKIAKLYIALKNSNNKGSITHVRGKALVEEFGKLDLLTYSFPCTDLSSAGNYHGKAKGMKKGSGTRSGMLWQIERIIEEIEEFAGADLLPSNLLLENVPQILNKNNKPDLDSWLNRLNELCYKSEIYEINSKDCGVPQSRNRIFIVSNFTGKKIDKPTVETKPISNFLRQDYSIKKYRKEALDARPNLTKSRVKMYENNVRLTSKDCKYATTLTCKQDRNPNAGMLDFKIEAEPRWKTMNQEQIIEHNNTNY